MDNKKHIVNLESFRDMLDICPRVHGQTFAEPPFEEEILAFIHFLGHNAAIRTLTDVKHKNSKKSNETYYTRLTKVIIHHFMSKDPSIPRRNKVNWYYVRDDHMFSTIKLVSRHQNTQQFGALLLIELTNEEIKNSNAYKEYYAIATGATPPKPKASVRRTRSSSDTSITPSTITTGPRLTTSAKGKQAAKASKAKRVPDVPTDESEEELSWNSTDDEGANDEGKDGDGDEEDEGDDGEEEDGNDDDNNQEVERDDDKEGGDDEEEYDEEIRDEESFDPILKTLENSDDEGDGMESIFETTSQMDVQTLTSMAPLPMSAPTMTPFTIATITITSQAPILPTTARSFLIQNLPNFGLLFCFDNRLRTLEANFSESMQTNQFAGAKIIKEQVKEQVMVQVFKILPRIEQTVNEQLKAEVLTRSSHSSKTSYDVAADLFEMELKKILIEKMEGNKSIQRSDEQKNLYKALVKAYESDKNILYTYRETVTLKRHRNDDADKDEEPFVGPDRGSKRRIEGKEPKSASAPTETTTRSAGRPLVKMEEPLHSEFDTGAEDQPIVQSSQHPEWFSQQQKPPSSDRDWNKTVDTLTPELLAGPTYKLMKGSCKSLVELEYHLQEVFKATTDQLDWVNPEGKLTNLTVEERFAFNVSLRMFTKSIVIQRRVEDLQMGVKSYQKKLNLTKSDSYRSDLKCKEAYTAYSNLWGFIYQNKDKKNRLIRIDELHKFSDGMLTDVRTAQDDRLKGIRMQSYMMQCTLPTHGMRSIIFTVFTSPEGFLPSILLLVVIIVAVVIVTVIWVVVVVDDISPILKLSFVIIVMFPSMLWGSPLMKASISFLVFGTMFGHKMPNFWNLLIIPPKRTSTFAASAITQAAIRQLVADSVTAPLEAQATTMAKNDLKTYIRRFQKLGILCPNMVPNTKKLMEAFIRGLPQSIEGNITASKPQNLEEATNIAQRLMDQILKHNSKQETNDHKRKFEDRRNVINNNNYPNNCNNNNCNNNHHQQQNG
nr:reverse transcriptase domain-containing protein [Tanacetum cinerariifolium]